MRVVFLEDVPGVARGGDVKEVRNGFARNYLIPKSLAIPATHNALQRVERLAREADVNRGKRLEDLTQLASGLDGTRVDIEMRAGSSGRLYGSVTNAMVADALSDLMEREIDRRTVEISEPIRQVGNFDVNIRLDPEVQAAIRVVVYPTGTEPPADIEEGQAEEGETEAASAEAVAEEPDLALPEAVADEAEIAPAEAVADEAVVTAAEEPEAASAEVDTQGTQVEEDEEDQ